MNCQNSSNIDIFLNNSITKPPPDLKYGYYSIKVTYLSALTSDGLSLVSSNSGLYSPLNRALFSEFAVLIGIRLVGVRCPPLVELVADGVGDTDVVGDS